MPAAAAIDERVACGERFFGAEADRLARLCHLMAERFARGGRLVAFGSSPADASDVRHVAVEFVHPVIVGKRALPALGVPCARRRAARRAPTTSRWPSARAPRSPRPCARPRRPAA